MNGARLKAAVFLCGASVMTMEMTGSRLLAPHLGTSIYVWTSLIGVILGALSAGYWWGGRLSDRSPRPEVLARLVLAAALHVAAVAFVGDAILAFLPSVTGDLRLGAALATVVFFGVPSVLLGAVSPYAARLSIRSVDESGSTVGSLYALSTIGSIAGTFLAGFWLVSWFSTPVIFLLTAGGLVISSVLVFSGKAWRRLAALVVIAAAAAAADGMWTRIRGAGFLDVNTRYNRVWIYDALSPDGRPVRIMQINDESSSKMYLPDEGLADRYTRFYRLAEHFRPDFRKSLMIGGAAYSYPKHYLEAYPNATIDVVEIDPGLTELAKRHFGLKDDPRLRVIHEDARTYLNRAAGSGYDVIYGDAFKSFSIPFQLTTVETARRMHDALGEEGVVVLNVISAVTGEKGRLLRAMAAAFREAFGRVYVFPVSAPDDGEAAQNLMLVAVKSKSKPRLSSADPEISAFLSHVWAGGLERDVPPLTDSFAPVDRYVEPVLADLHDRFPSPLRERLEALLARFDRNETR